MVGWSPQCYIPSFVEIRRPVPEKKIFEGFLPYRGVAAILVMCPASCHQICIFLYLKAFMQSLVQIDTVVSLFSEEKPTLPNLTLPLNRSRSLEGHHLNKL